MDYNLLICISKDKLMAMDIQDEDVVDRISIEGNDSIDFQQNSDIENFCEHIKNYYNIEQLSEITINASVIYFNSNKDNLNILLECLKDVASINVIDSKKILPIIALKKLEIEEGTIVNINCFDNQINIEVGENFQVNYIDEKEGTLLDIEPEELKLLYFFDCEGLVADKNKAEELEQKYQIALKKEQEKTLKVKEDYVILEKKYKQVSEELEKINEAVKNRMELLESRRQIIKFEEEEEEKEKEKEEVEHTNGGLFSFINDAMKETMKVVEKYQSALENIYLVENKHRDGDIVSAKKIIANVRVYKNLHNSDKTEVSKDNLYCQRTISIKTSEAGKIYYLRKDDEVINVGADIAILADPRDTREQVMEWYNQIRK